MIGGHLRHWLDDRWAWLRPRTVPMIVAFAGMLAVLGTTKYLTSYAIAPTHSAALIDRDGAPELPKARNCFNPKHYDPEHAKHKDQ